MLLDLPFGMANSSSESQSSTSKFCIPVVKLLRLFNRCNSKWGFIGIVALHGSLLIYYVVYMNILYPNKFKISLEDGDTIEVSPHVWILFISAPLTRIFIHLLMVGMEMIHIKIGDSLKAFYGAYLDFYFVTIIQIAFYIEDVLDTIRMFENMGDHLARSVFFIFSTVAVLQVFSTNFRTPAQFPILHLLRFSIDKIFTNFFTNSLLIGILIDLLLNPAKTPACDCLVVVFLTLFLIRTYLLVCKFANVDFILSILCFNFCILLARNNLKAHAIPFSDFAKVGIESSHHVHGIVDSLVKKYNLDKKVLFLTGFEIDTLPKVFLKTIGSAASQTLTNDFIFLEKNDVVNENTDFLKFTVYHEYCHIVQNHLILRYLYQIITKVILMAVFRRSESCKTLRHMLGLFSYSCLAKSAFDLLDMSFKCYHEFLADDFSQSHFDGLLGIKAFYTTHAERTDANMTRFLAFYPPWFPYTDHPSLYHRLIRQMTNVKKNPN